MGRARSRALAKISRKHAIAVSAILILIYVAGVFIPISSEKLADTSYPCRSYFEGKYGYHILHLSPLHSDGNLSDYRDKRMPIYIQIDDCIGPPAPIQHNTGKLYFW